MKILTVNFLTCAVKACKSSPLSFPLHFKDAELEQQDMEYNPLFLRNILARIEWDALRTTAAELGFTNLPETKPEIPLLDPSQPATVAAEASSSENDESAGAQDAMQVGEEPATFSGEEEKLWRDLHRLLMETQVMEGKMVCGNCGHEYKIKEGIANFLLPNHMV